MHVVEQLKRLISNSRLFVDEEKLNKPAGKKRARRDNVKIGQGGTLDPLADGVLGQLNFVLGNSFLVWCVERQRRAVVGVGKGTKKLNGFLDCAKVRVAYGSMLTHKLIP
jgi:tRNA pseudouridine55 synthase